QASQFATAAKEQAEGEIPLPCQSHGKPSPERGFELTSRGIAGRMILREARLARQTRRLIGILGWEAAMGVAILICIGLMNVFAATILPTTDALQLTTGIASAFHTAAMTSARKFAVTLTVDPNQPGPYVFIVSIVDNKTGTPTTNISLSTADLDMD